jgi:hypothetical protein
MYHCKIVLGAGEEILSLHLGELTMYLLSGWLPAAAPCLPGAVI